MTDKGPTSLRYAPQAVWLKSLLVFALVAALGVAGWAVYKDHHKSLARAAATAQAAAPSSSWTVCNDTTEGLSFRYPSVWSTAGSTTATPCSVKNTGSASDDYLELQSPPVASSPDVFQLSFFADDVDNVFDTSKGQTILAVTPLNSPGSKTPLYLVAYADNATSPAQVFGLGVTDQHYRVGKAVDYVQAVRSQKINGDYYIFSAVLTQPGQQSGGSYSLSQYQAQPDYPTVVKIFQSLRY